MKKILKYVASALALYRKNMAYEGIWKSVF